jgi:hypothetical protein
MCVEYDILLGMGGIFQNGINRKYYCGFGCGCGFVFALTIAAAIDAASATAGFHHHHYLPPLPLLL